MTKTSALLLASSLLACAHGVNDADDAQVVAIGTSASEPPPVLLELAAPTTTNAIRPMDQDALYVLMPEERSIQLLHVVTGDWLATIHLRAETAPGSMTLSPDGEKLAIAFPGNGGALLVIEASTGRTLASTRLPAANGNAAFSPDGSEIWTAQDDGFVLVLDAETLATKDRLVAGKRPSHVAFAGDQVWVSNELGGDVSGFDRTSHALVGAVQVEPGPRAIWTGADGRLYIDCASSLSVVDPVTLGTRRIAMGSTPGRAVVADDGTVWVTSGEGHVSVFDVRGLEVSRFATAPGASDIVLTPGSFKGFVTNERSGSITLFDPPTHAPIATVHVGDRPSSAFFRPARSPLAAALTP